MTDRANKNTIAEKLLNWYDQNRRDLPWRARPGEQKNPYQIWLSEIMLQQTTVATVKDYYRAFLKRWPKVEDLAQAPLDDVLHAWQGLGYYARARNLHKCANVVANDLNGEFPRSEKGLRSLPGIGDYTAAALMALVHGEKATPVDGNIERVVARLFRIATPLPEGKKDIRKRAVQLTPDVRTGDYAQAMMDLGATLCSPKKPACSLCPLSEDCEAYAKDVPETFPRRKAKPPKPTRQAIIYWIERPDGSILLRRRPENGLLGGMMEFPSTDWRETPTDIKAAQRNAPVSAVWRPLPGEIRHTFTHFHLVLTVLKGKTRGTPPINGLWCAPQDMGSQALPTVMKKVLRHALRLKESK